eukprot:7189-Rhodomonas_salina.2
METVLRTACAKWRGCSGIKTFHTFGSSASIRALMHANKGPIQSRGWRECDGNTRWNGTHALSTLTNLTLHSRHSRLRRTS